MPKANEVESAPPHTFANAGAFSRWLAKHHASSQGIWLRIAKKGASETTVTYSDAVDVALAWGWIDGQKRALDDQAWVQRFTPRQKKSIWSQINCGKVEALLAKNAMFTPGIAAVESAKADGRWAKAYPSPKAAVVADDLVAALAAQPAAAKLYAALDAANRYAIAYRIHQTKTPEARAKKIADLVAMLARGETIHPRRPAKSKGS